MMTLSEFSAITKIDSFPGYLRKHQINDTLLEVYCNGSFDYTLKDIHARVSVTWAYKAPEGGGDTHFSLMRGTKANLIIRQGIEQDYVPTLYIESISMGRDYEKLLNEQIKKIQNKYPGIDLKKQDGGWEVVIPKSYRNGHEAHFAQVTENFLSYLKNGTLPDWEVPNMITKYYTTVQALQNAVDTE